MTQIRILLLPIFISFTSLLIASPPDSLVKKEELFFHSNLEKIAFESLENETGPNYMYLFVAIDENCNADELNAIRHSLTNLQNQFKQNSRFAKSKEEKKTKLIFNEVRDRYFKNYGLDYYFTNLFNGGNYNTITASAILGITFEALEIPYTIKKSYDNIYLITFPESAKIPVKFIEPTAENSEFDDQTKQQFIEYMAEAGQISQADKKQKSTDELFEEIYFSEKAINLLELAGIQYYNRAVDLMDYEQFEDAFKMAEKSYYLNQSDDAGYLLLVCLANTLNNCNYEDIHYADYIYKAARFSKYGITNDDVIGQFADVNNKLLITTYNTELYDAYYDRIIKNLTDSTQINEVSFIYNYERGRILYNDNNFTAALAFIEKAHNLKPKHVDARNLFISVVMKTFWQLNDPIDALVELDRYAETYPELATDNGFNTLRATLTLALGLDLFERNNPQSAFEKITEFESMAEGSTLDDANYFLTKIVEEVYSRAASHFFRKGNMKQAKNYLEKGLKYAPNSYVLESKLSSLKY